MDRGVRREDASEFCLGHLAIALTLNLKIAEFFKGKLVLRGRFLADEKTKHEPIGRLIRTRGYQTFHAQQLSGGKFAWLYRSDLADD